MKNGIIQLRFAAFSLIDGIYNVFIESESISICEMPKSEHPLISFVYKEMSKAGNLTSACPVKKGHYFLHTFGIDEGDMPVSLPAGNFKIELNGTMHEHDKDTLVFISDIYFKESE